jgi:hypothetical protein
VIVGGTVATIDADLVGHYNPGSYDASTGTWTDLSGNANHLVQSVVADRASKSTWRNSEDGVVFDGVSDYCYKAGTSTNSVGQNGSTRNWTVIICGEYDAAGADLGIFFGTVDFTAQTNRTEFGIHGSSQIGIDRDGGTTNATSTAGVTYTKGDPFIFVVRCVAGETLTIREGEVVTNDTNAPTGTMSDQNLWAVATDPGAAGSYFEGILGDIKIWTRALTDSEIGSELIEIGGKYDINFTTAR